MTIDWFHVSYDADVIHLSVRPPRQDSWSVDLPWPSIVKVCWRAGDATSSAGLYVFTDLGPDSVAIPTDAIGGPELVDELIRRELYDADLARVAAAATIGLFCWPPD
jgi:hypothetical protein